MEVTTGGLQPKFDVIMVNCQQPPKFKQSL